LFIDVNPRRIGPQAIARPRLCDPPLVQFIYQYPETNGTERDMLDAGPVDEVARVAEQCGFMGLSFTEHPVPGARWLEAGGHQSLDPFVALGFAAAATTRLRLLTYLSVAPYRNPLLLAKTAATLDKLSGGRLILGIGTGYLKREFKALGVDFEERNALFDEALDVLPLHWKGEPFSYAGRHFDAQESIARPRPVQDPIPIWIGGNAKITRKRVAERAQGWMPLNAPVGAEATVRTSALGGLQQVAEAIAEIRDAAAPRGEPIDVVYSYGDASLRTAPDKDVERHRDAIAELEAIGITWVVISGTTTSFEATRDFIEAFGGTYVDRRPAT
jgi:probable F420-dependent oxidoreductase